MKKSKLKPLNTPILFLIFNRPDTTQLVFNEIKKAKPKQLFITADGARNREEWQECNKTGAVINQVDWPRELHFKFEEKKLEEILDSEIVKFMKSQGYQPIMKTLNTLLFTLILII